MDLDHTRQTRMTTDAITQAILNHWKRQWPKEVAKHSPQDVQEAAEARASMAEMEMEVLMAEQLMNREQAWSEASRIFLSMPPAIHESRR